MSSQSGDVTSVRRRRIGILCLSAIPDDPRVRRQGDLFHAEGWDVTAIGLPGARSVAPVWRCIEVDTAARPQILSGSSGDPAARIPGNQRALRFAVRAGAYAYWRLAYPVMRRASRALGLLRLSFDPSYAQSVYWTLNDRFDALYDEARKHKVDMWLANDWTTLPIAAKLAREQGVPYVYDTHELAVDEYAQHLRWRLFSRPVIAAVERQGIGGAVFTSCVSQGIANRLFGLYRLARKPLLIRNMPNYEACLYRPCGETIRVLYHGVVSPGRGLEECIASVALWRPEFTFTIRGPASADYLASLQACARTAGVEDRVTFAPPVPMIELVRAASEFDVGLFALPGHSEQNLHVLPNKFFEYTMAGLALCVSDLPEMADLLKTYDLGVLVTGVSPAAIAAAINLMDPETINRFRQNALLAARDLNWQGEGQKFIQACDIVVPV